MRRSRASRAETLAPGKLRSVDWLVMMRRVTALAWPLALVACIGGEGGAVGAAQASRAVDRVATDSSFAALIERLSEPGGYFDTDNLISNERSYLHVVGKLRELGIEGGVYIGVGPDQNFSYIAQVRPSIAFIIDIRRDNLLQQLMFKALFALARNRAEYLSLLHGRPVPDDVSAWEDRSIQQLVDYIDGAPALVDAVDATQASLEAELRSFGVPLTDADLVTIRRFRSTFISEGLSLRFRSHGRRARPYYPSYRQLLLEEDLSGRQASYLAREEDFQFVKSLQERNLIVPVVGDLAGDHALAAIGSYVGQLDEQVTAFYTSNVEFYLWRDGGFDRFVRNLRGLPFDERGVIIRSFFGGNFRYTHPQAVSGYYSTQLLQTLESLVTEYSSGSILSYLDLVSVGYLELR